MCYDPKEFDDNSRTGYGHPIDGKDLSKPDQQEAGEEEKAFEEMYKAGIRIGEILGRKRQSRLQTQGGWTDERVLDFCQKFYDYYHSPGVKMLSAKDYLTEYKKTKS